MTTLALAPLSRPLALAPLSRTLALFLTLATWLTGCGPGEGERLLAAGRYAEVLQRVRLGDARAHRLHGAALLGLGQVEAARRALRISLALDDRSVATLQLLAGVERRRGRGGAAFRLLRRAGRRDLAALSADSRRLLGRYYALRARLRGDPARWRSGSKLAEERAAAEALGTKVSATPPTVAELAAEGLRACPGAPKASTVSPPAKSRCQQGDLRGVLAALRQRDLLLGCHGVAQARRLEARGCLAAALKLWRLLRRELPKDPRWILQIGRIEVARDRMLAAQTAFEQHAFESPDRAAGSLRVAAVLMAAGRQATAGRWAVRALELAPDGQAQLRALRALRDSGQAAATRQAARVILHERPALKAAVDAIMQTRSPPTSGPSSR